jgi:hypothetical protein
MTNCYDTAASNTERKTFIDYLMAFISVEHHIERLKVGQNCNC